MPRKPGIKNRDHAQKRKSMIAEISDFWLSVFPETPSYRQISDATSISFSNLRHYFPTARSLYGEVILHWAEKQARVMAGLDIPLNSHPRQGLRRLARFFIEKWQGSNVQKYHKIGLSRSFIDGEILDVYQQALYRPMLYLVKTHIENWVRLRMLSPIDSEMASRNFVSPIFMFLLLEREGKTHSATETEGFVDQHVKIFLSGIW